MICLYSNATIKSFRKKIIKALIRFLNAIKVSLYRAIFSDNSPIVHAAKIHLPTQFIGKGKIELDKCQLGVWPSPFFIDGTGYLEVRETTASIYIGHGTAINNDFSIIADKSSITIGKRCLIGPKLFITDSDFHGIDVCDRNSSNYATAPVLIEDDVFIGSNVTVLKGSKIGTGSVIASGSIVIGDLENHFVYGGIPAKKLKKICS